MEQQVQAQGAPAEAVVEEVEMGAGGVPKGKCFIPGNPVFSCSLDIPPEKPLEETGAGIDYFKAYPEKKVHPMFRKTSDDYGSRRPTVHTMPTEFHSRTQKFSQHLGTCGMYRNHSLNTAGDKTVVPDH